MIEPADPVSHALYLQVLVAYVVDYEVRWVLSNGYLDSYHMSGLRMLTNIFNVGLMTNDVSFGVLNPFELDAESTRLGRVLKCIYIKHDPHHSMQFATDAFVPVPTSYQPPIPSTLTCFVHSELGKQSGY